MSDSTIYLMDLIKQRIYMSNMIEDWKDIPGYEGLYVVSNNGRVMNVRSGRILKEHITKFGYKRIGIYKNGVCRMHFVHRLVAEAFIPNPDNLPQVNHKNEDKINNNVDNLEWCDSKYNMNYGTRKEKERDTKMKNEWWTGLSRKEYRKRWYDKNRSNKREYQKRWYEMNRSNKLAYQREYYIKKKNDKIDE